MVENSSGPVTALLPARPQPRGCTKLVFDLAQTILVGVTPAAHPRGALHVPAAAIAASEPAHPEIPPQSKPDCSYWCTTGHKQTANL